MTRVRAQLNDYRQSPRKVRLVSDLIKGKDVARAMSILQTVPKSAAEPLLKLLNSAVANAKHNFSLDSAVLHVRDIRVDEGKTLKRIMPRARGSAFPIRKRTSHISLILSEKSPVKL